MVGKAAHISGAAPGKGSRRYNVSMSSEELRSIANAIWLGAYHADVIDVEYGYVLDAGLTSDFWVVYQTLGFVQYDRSADGRATAKSIKFLEQGPLLK